MKFFRKVWEWLLALFGRGALQTIIVEELPEDLSRKAVYLVGENNLFWCAGLLCPCGCRALIQLNLVTSTRPAWRFERHPETDTLTLSPSVWRTKGCRSHFFLRNGRIRWCSPQDGASADR